MNFSTLDDGSYLHTFDSIGEYIDLAQNRESFIPDSSCASRRTEERVFSGTATFEDAVELAYKGYPAARKVGEPIRHLFLDALTPVVIKKKPRYDLVGDTIDVSRYLTGMPDPFMIRYEPVHGTTEIGKSKKIFRIVVNITYEHRVPQESILHRGATIAALVDLMESADKRVEVIAVTSIGESRWMFDDSETKPNAILHNFIPVKSPGQALDIDFLYFVLAHPAMLRRFSFGVWESYPKEICDPYGIPHGNYGIVRPPTQQLDADLYLPHVIDHTTFASPLSSKKWLIRILLEQNLIEEKDALDLAT